VGHAEHFLSRLDRLASAEVELALELYRDPGLLRAVLQVVKLPDAAERVAISLDDSAAGPYLVVTRDGHFVTCLARGMRPRNAYLPHRRKGRRSRGGIDQALHDYWNLLHAAGHLALLGTMGGDSEHFQKLTESQPEARSAFSFALTSTGVTRFIVQGAWATGRLGKQVLPAYKRALGEDVALFDWLDTVFGLVAIGRRTSGTRTEIAKAFRAVPTTARTAGAARLREGLGDALETLSAIGAELLEMEASEAERILSRFGARLLSDTGDEEHGQLAGLPKDVLCAIPLGSYADGLTGGKKILSSLTLIAATARGASEQFYLPREYARELRLPWEPALTRRLLDPIRDIERAQRVPAVRAVKPGPNEPCSCGSGRKHKKCCGAP
jgi:hypothetical protein